jgi:hypothetical protein
MCGCAWKLTTSINLFYIKKNNFQTNKNLHFLIKKNKEILRVELGSQLMQTALFLNFDNLLIKN